MRHARWDYDRIQDPQGLIGEDEPVFLIRATDKVGPSAVRIWAFLVKEAGAKHDIVEAALHHALDMVRWQEENASAVHVPDMPAPER